MAEGPPPAAAALFALLRGAPCSEAAVAAAVAAAWEEAAAPGRAAADALAAATRAARGLSPADLAELRALAVPAAVQHVCLAVAALLGGDGADWRAGLAVVPEAPPAVDDAAVARAWALAAKAPAQGLARVSRVADVLLRWARAVLAYEDAGRVDLEAGTQLVRPFPPSRNSSLHLSLRRLGQHVCCGCRCSRFICTESL